MKKLVIASTILLILVFGGLLIVSCAGDDFTNTVTVQPPGGSSTVVTPTFTVSPPEIPHVYIIEDNSNPYISGLIADEGGAICFVCHGTIPQHSIWADDPHICADCHVVSDNPVLVPR